jgi:glycosyltransferase involved in cell wall biosynthesis
MAKDLSIVVCTYNRASLLAECLQSLAMQTLAAWRFEVLIVDNNSNDETWVVAEKFCREYHNFRVVFELEQGLSQARNRGWKEARGTYVAYIDDDGLAERDWCERILASFEYIVPTPWAVGGKILPRYTDLPPVWFSDRLETRSWGGSASFLKPPGAKYGFSGANMAFPRKLLEDFGGFSSRLGMVGEKVRMGEDTEFFLRLSALQHNLFWYDPLIVVKHWTSTKQFSLRARFFRSFQGGRSHYYFESCGGETNFKTLLSAFYQLSTGGTCLLKPSGEKLAHVVRSVERALHQFGLYVESLVAKRKISA